MKGNRDAKSCASPRMDQGAGCIGGPVDHGDGGFVQRAKARTELNDAAQ